MNIQPNQPDTNSQRNALNEGVKPGLKTKSGFFALIGSPNAGKSTLLNQLVGSKVSIVTHKVQTTRTIVRGIVVRDNTQIVFLDTPGIFQPRRKLDRAMVDAAWSGAGDTDTIGLLVDSTIKFDENHQNLLSKLSKLALPKVLILNKIDQVKRELLLDLSRRINEMGDFKRTFMISALNGDGVEDILDFFVATAKPGPFFYPEDQMSDLPLRLLAAEITREKLFIRLHDELPYSSTVETSSWDEMDDGSVRIEQTIFVERDSQKGIVIGKGGQTLKDISKAARLEIAKITEHKVHLYIFVKVRRNWSDQPEHFQHIGLEIAR